MFQYISWFLILIHPFLKGETADESANREVNKDTNENTEFTNETNESQMEDLENSYSNLVQAGVQPNLQFR